MGAAAHLEATTLPVTPGGEAGVEIRVRNSGGVVDQFTLEVVGDAAPWSSAEPPSVSLFPAAEERARIVFRPPRTAQVAAGPMPFGVRVQSREDPAGSVVEEGVLEVEPFTDTFAELIPRTSRGGRGASHDLALDNRGNTRLNATLSADDPDRLLKFDLRPPSLVADPGTAAFARVGVRPRRTFWRGPPKSRPFHVRLEAADGPPMSVDGTLLQESLLPPWLLKAVAAAIGLLILAAILWLAFLQPTIEATAREHAEDAIDERLGQGDGADGTDDGSSSGASPGDDPTIPPLAGGAVPRDGRLAPESTLSADSDTTLFLTDLIFSNPDPSAVGDIRLQRDGEDILVLQLENFRDIDFHFVTPLVVTAAQTVTLVCDSPPCPDGAAVFYSGYQR